MRAIVIDKIGDRGTLRDLPPPEPKTGEVVVRIRFAGVNPVDWKTRAGQGAEITLPHVLGQDFAGIVERSGSGIARLSTGNPVFGMSREGGSYAEMTVVSESDHASPVAQMPEGLPADIAAALPTPGVTALASVNWLQADNGVPLLIIGAAGAVGSIATQLAAHRGAKVTAVVRSGEAAVSHKDGASDVIEANGDPLEAIKAKHQSPFPAVLDLVNDQETIARHAPLYAKGGRFISTIHSAHEGWFAEHGIELLNIVATQQPESSPLGLETLAELVLTKKLRIDIAGQRALGDAPDLLDAMQAGKQHGKYVLRAG